MAKKKNIDITKIAQENSAVDVKQLVRNSPRVYGTMAG